jgi:glycerol-3-phosphate dehydrogenase
MNRNQQLERITSTEKFDLCIIGAGATGAGIALDATLRGLKVLLIDKNDFAGQTSSKSTKLIHGGVRYLEQAVKKLDKEQFFMVRKSLYERDTLIKNAPHLTRKLPLLTPCYSWFEGFYLTIGLKIYEWISGKHSIGASKWLSKKESLKLIPDLRKENLKSGVLYYDGQLDDARYCLAIIQKAEELGAVVLNYAEAVSFIRDEKTHYLSSLIIRDGIDDKTFKINAEVFVNATGPFADHIRQMANPSLEKRIKVSRGAHIVLPRDVMKSETAMLIPKTDDGRVLFIIPWQDTLLVGTTDEEDELSEFPKLEKNEIPYLLNYVNRYLDKTVTPEQIKGSFAGQRPLLQKSKISADTKSLVRDHEIEVDNASNLVSIMGGKWTTYRLMAKDTIDHIYKAIWNKTAPACDTDNQLLYGAENYQFDDWRILVATYNVSEKTAQHLMKKYGAKAIEVLKLTANDSSLKELLSNEHPFIKAEVIYTIEEEMATNCTDVLERRLGLSLRDEKAAEHSEEWINSVFMKKKSTLRLVANL